MKFSLECKVESKIGLANKIEIERGDRKYIFCPDNNGTLTRIKIVSGVRKSEKFYSEIEYRPNERVKHHMVVNRDKELYESMIRDFQELESILAFDGNLTRIMWDEPKDEVICENQEEREKVRVFSTHSRKEYPDPIKKVNEDVLRNMISTKEKYVSLAIPKAFWREGNNDFKSFRYINAFFNFYFILEGLYGNRKTKNYAVEREFKKSKEFNEFVEWMIDHLRKAPRHLKKVNEMLKYRSKNLDVDGIIHLVVATRGDLHHFADDPNKTRGTPFNHKEFESIAWVALGLAIRAILQKMIEINLSS